MLYTAMMVVASSGCLRGGCLFPWSGLVGIFLEIRGRLGSTRKGEGWENSEGCVFRTGCVHTGDNAGAEDGFGLLLASGLRWFPHISLFHRSHCFVAQRPDTAWTLASSQPMKHFGDKKAVCLVKLEGIFRICQLSA